MGQRIFFLAAFGLMLTACSPAPARQAPPDLAGRLTAPGACYTRAYEAAHLAAHPQQTVTRFFLGDPGEDWRSIQTQGEFNVAFGFQLVGRNDVYSGIGVCRPSEAGASCDIEGDGGAFAIEPNGEGLRIRVARMEVEGPNDFSPDLALADNRVMLLRTAAAGDCAVP